MAEHTNPPPAGTGEYKRFYTLDALRGLAALGVALFHFRWTHAEMHAVPVFDQLFTLLDFFFVLSGFVLAHVYLAQPLSFGRFCWRRLARLYPLHVFALLMFLLMQVGKMALIGMGVGTRAEAFAGMNVTNFLDALLLLQWTGLLGTAITWNYPAWTVSTELFGALIIYALVVRLGRERVAAVSIGLMLACGLYMLAWSVEPSDYGPNALVRTVFGMAIGCALHSIYARHQLIRGPVWGTIAELSVAVLVLALISGPASGQYWYLSTFGLAVAVYVFAAEQGIVSIACKRLQLHRLGTGSYSIYMNHAVVGAVFSKVYLMVAPGLGITGLMSVAVYVPVFILILAAYSRFTLRYVERPGRALWLRAGERMAGAVAAWRRRRQPVSEPRIQEVGGSLVRRHGA